MADQENSPAPEKMAGHRWRRAFFCIAIFWISSSILVSTPWFRAWLSYPLHVSNLSGKCDVAYVMSDGHAYWNRLCAASDLYHIGKIKKIAIQENPTTSRYDFVLRRSLTVAQRSIRSPKKAPNSLLLYGLNTVKSRYTGSSHGEDSAGS